MYCVAAEHDSKKEHITTSRRGYRSLLQASALGMHTSRGSPNMVMPDPGSVAGPTNSICPSLDYAAAVGSAASPRRLQNVYVV
jgi:hypothetical protein